MKYTVVIYFHIRIYSLSQSRFLNTHTLTFYTFINFYVAFIWKHRIQLAEAQVSFFVGNGCHFQIGKISQCVGCVSKLTWKTISKLLNSWKNTKDQTFFCLSNFWSSLETFFLFIECGCLYTKLNLPNISKSFIITCLSDYWWVSNWITNQIIFGGKNSFSLT